MTRARGKKIEEDHRYGDQIGKSIVTNCRYCGTRMYFLEETDNAFIMGCPYPDCPNNPDTVGKTPWELTQKRPMGSRKETQF